MKKTKSKTKYSVEIRKYEIISTKSQKVIDLFMSWRIRLCVNENNQEKNKQICFKAKVEFFNKHYYFCPVYKEARLQHFTSNGSETEERKENN